MDSDWTLFLDRDGVINVKLDADYVKTWNEFQFLPEVLPALAQAAKAFKTIVIVTNQQGVGKGLMTTEALNDIHHKMKDAIEAQGGRIDQIYFCPDLAHTGSQSRKPAIGMAKAAQAEFPQIDFAKSIIIGDSESDMEFGANAGMFRCFIARDLPDRLSIGAKLADFSYLNLPAAIAGILEG